MTQDMVNAGLEIRLWHDGFDAVRSFAHRKMRADFKESKLDSPDGLSEDKELSHQILVAAGIAKEVRLQHLFRKLSTRQTAYDGLSSDVSLKLIRDYTEKHGKIVVMTSAIAVSSLAVLRSLNKRHKPILLCETVDIQFKDVNGRDQMLTIGQAGPKCDFFIAPDGAFFLNDGSVHNEYKLLTPFFIEDQYLLRRKDYRACKGGFVWTFPWSSADTMVRAWMSKTKKRGMEPNALLAGMTIKDCDAKDLPNIAKQLIRADMLIAWEPLASELVRQADERRERDSKAINLVKVPGSWFPVVFSLSAHERWATPDRDALRNAFDEILIAEWNHCRVHPDYAWSLLEYDLEFLQYFASGAGCELPQISSAECVNKPPIEVPEQCYPLKTKALPESYVSYAWGEDSSEAGRQREDVVNKMCEALSLVGRIVRRDKTDMKPGDSIDAFAAKIAKAQHIIAVISEKSLYSKYCMVDEIFSAYQRCGHDRAEFQSKVIALVMDDATQLLKDDIALLKHWQGVYKKEYAELKAVDRQRRQIQRWAKLHKLEEMCNHLLNMLVAINDTIMPRGYENIVRGNFKEVIGRLVNPQI